MKTIILFACAAISCGAVFGGAEKPEELWPEGKMPSPQKNQSYKPYLTWFTPEKRTTDAILISVSGGGYGGCGVEGFEVAPIRDYMLAKGMTVVTMRYRCPRPEGLAKHVTAWQDAQRTVRLVRSEARKRGLNPDNIGFTGCSAGGHLAMMVATSSQTPAYAPVDEIDQLPCNVNWAFPVYPAYLLADGVNQCNTKKGNDLSDGFAPELKFDAATPPMCFFHGDMDGWSPMGSVRAYHKLRTMGIPAELHVMALEAHCFQSNPRPGTPAANWKDRAWDWLVSMDVVTGHPQTWKEGWKPVFSTWGKKLDTIADFEPGVWHTIEWGGAILTAEKDSALWLKGEDENFVLDFEYKLDPAANSGVVIYCSDVKNWIPNSVEIQLLDDHADKWKNDPPRLKNGALYGHCGPAESNVKPAGQWNRMTVYAQGKRVKVVVNGRTTVDADLSQYTSAKTNPDGTPIQPWLSRPMADLPTKGRVGFQGKHGGARPYFRNVRILQL